MQGKLCFYECWLVPFTRRWSLSGTVCLWLATIGDTRLICTAVIAFALAILVRLLPLPLMARACFPLCRHHFPFPASFTSRISRVSRWCTLVSIACDCIMHLSGPFNLVSLPIFPSFVHVEPISISPAFSLSFLKCLHSTTPFAKPLSLSLCARLHHCTTDVIADGR